MRVLSDSKLQTTHHSKKSGMYEKAVKGNVTIKMTKHKRIAWKKEATRRYHTDTRNRSENVPSPPTLTQSQQY